jgi:hypothetical protein
MPLASKGRLYLWADNGLVTCARLATGDVLWREKVAGSFYSSPVCVNGRLYCVAKNGDVVVLADADNGRGGWHDVFAHLHAVVLARKEITVKQQRKDPPRLGMAERISMCWRRWVTKRC